MVQVTNDAGVSPLKGFHIPSDTRMPQTQADLVVYVKKLLVQMVRQTCACAHVRKGSLP